jgi:hypothetical protein
MNSYWGGTVPAIGGTLVLGALARLEHRPATYALTIAAGLEIVMNSRPLEAFLLGLLVCACVARCLLRGRMSLTRAAVRVALPAGVVLCATLGAMAYYNRSVTGDALQFPYMLHQKMYGTPQPFWWQEAVTVSGIRHKEIEDDYLRQKALYDRRSSPPLLLRSIASRTFLGWLFFLGVPLAIPLLFLRRSLGDRALLFALGAALPFALDHLTFHAFYPHYAAPAIALLYLAVAACWRRMREWSWRGAPVGLAFARAIPVAALAGVAIPALSFAAGTRALWPDLFDLPPARSRIVRQLEQAGGTHLVLVRYRPEHHPDNEWVRNSADIPAAPIAWARDLGREANRELLRHFPGRMLWLLEPDVHPVRLRPYPDAHRYASAP